MTQVFFTIDTEIWCDGWHDLDRKFPEAFRRYIVGPTNRGDFGLGYQLKVLNDHGLNGTFFVEPLFALRFGLDPLAEIVGMIREAGQEVQLHLHTEWIDEVQADRLFPDIREKRQHLAHFNLAQQTRLIAEGKRLLEAAGAPTPLAFRAGSFGMNGDTLEALVANHIYLDSSYNALIADSVHGRICDQLMLFQPLLVNGVTEFPLTVYQDRPGHYRHAQICACSTAEIVGLLDYAEKEEWHSVVILSHNFELLNSSRTHLDHIVTRRFQKLCRFLERERHRFPTVTFASQALGRIPTDQKEPYRGSLFHTTWRLFEQGAIRAQQMINGRNARSLTDIALGTKS